jgi:hypothetical protein
MTAAKVIKKAAARTEIWISSIRIPRASRSPFNSESFWVLSLHPKLKRLFMSGYSAIRFSSVVQAQGDSLRRQTDLSA